MGHRTVKRVPLDFEWPPNRVWEGYLNPHYGQSRECSSCQGTGYAERAKFLSDQWYGHAPFDPAEVGSQPMTTQTPAVRAFARRNVESAPGYYPSGEAGIEWEAERLSGMWNEQWCHHLAQEDVDALIEAGRLHDFTHDWEQGKGWTPIVPRPTVSAEQVNEWSIGGFGHDSINQWVCIKAKCAREGAPVSCSICDGECRVWPSPKIKAAYENWEMEEPPEGEGWQLWETVSEGSPMSPVFAAPDELARWCETNATIFAREKISCRQWLQLITGEENLNVGSLMTMVQEKGERFVGSVAGYNEHVRDSAKDGSDDG